MKRRPTLFLPLLVLITGCLHQPQAYQAADEVGARGYASAQTAPNRFVVHFTGSGSASDAILEALALRRAAELTIMHGGTWFDAVDRESVDEILTTRPRSLSVRQIDPVFLRTGFAPFGLGVTPPITAGANFTSRLRPDADDKEHQRVTAREYTIQIEVHSDDEEESPNRYNAFTLLDQVAVLTDTH